MATKVYTFQYMEDNVWRLKCKLCHTKLIFSFLTILLSTKALVLFYIIFKAWRAMQITQEMGFLKGHKICEGLFAANNIPSLLMCDNESQKLNFFLEVFSKQPPKKNNYLSKDSQFPTSIILSCIDIFFVHLSLIHNSSLNSHNIT